MWKAGIGAKPPTMPKPSAKQEEDDDDWETDPNFLNNVSEKEGRWGAKTVIGSGHQESVSLDQLRGDVLKSDALVKEKAASSQVKGSVGYGGKFGVERDRVDKCAEGFQYAEAHPSTTDFKKGFGGVHGIDKDRMDKSAVGWGEKAELSKHGSQTDQVMGHGGKYGVQSDRMDKSAVGWSEKAELSKHQSQTDQSKGFGGLHGVQSDRMDKSAVGWGEKAELSKHQSQSDQSKGFGGKFGVQTDRMDKSAAGWDSSHKSTSPPPDVVKKGVELPEGSEVKGRASSLRRKFEQLANQQQQGGADQKAKEERERRLKEDEELKKRQAEEEERRQQKIDEEWAGKEVVEGQGEPTAVASPTRTRPNIGVRLPIAPTAPQESPAPPKPVRHSEVEITQQVVVTEEVLGQGKQARVQVLPPSVISQHMEKMAIIPDAAAEVLKQQPSPIAVGMIHRRQSSQDDDDEWEEEPAAAKVLQLQQPPPTHVHHQPQPKYEEPPAQHQFERYEEPPMEPEHVAPAPPTTTAAVDGNGLTAIAIFEYERQDVDEIGFQVGDLITDIDQIDVGWWRGTCGGRYGLFPANYVQLNSN